MSYIAIVDMTRQPVFLDRVAGCAATQGVENPENWAREHAYKIAVYPGMVEAYEPPPGTRATPGRPAEYRAWDVPEELILAAVQSLLPTEQPGEVTP